MVVREAEWQYSCNVSCGIVANMALEGVTATEGFKKVASAFEPDR